MPAFIVHDSNGFIRMFAKKASAARYSSEVAQVNNWGEHTRKLPMKFNTNDQSYYHLNAILVRKFQ